MNPADKPLVWLHGQIKTPPFSPAARLEAGYLLRRLLRITDGDLIWRIIYRVDHDAIVIPEVFNKKTRETPRTIIEICKARLKSYDELTMR